MLISLLFLFTVIITNSFVASKDKVTTQDCLLQRCTDETLKTKCDCRAIPSSGYYNNVRVDCEKKEGEKKGICTYCAKHGKACSFGIKGENGWDRGYLACCDQIGKGNPKMANWGIQCREQKKGGPDKCFEECNFANANLTRCKFDGPSGQYLTNERLRYTKCSGNTWSECHLLAKRPRECVAPGGTCKVDKDCCTYFACKDKKCVRTCRVGGESCGEKEFCCSAAGSDTKCFNNRCKH